MTIQKTIIAAALVILTFADATAMQKSTKSNNQKNGSQNSKALVVTNGNVKSFIETPNKNMWSDIKKNHHNIPVPVIIGQTQDSKIFVTKEGIGNLKFKSRM